MKAWDIKVLYLGKITVKMSALWPTGMPSLPEDFELEVPYLGFLLQSEKRNILIDTGISEKFIVNGKAWGGFPAEGGKKFLEKALAKQALTTNDIDTIIYTHLHNDHAANCNLFPRARVIFQKDEWRNLLYPLPVQLLRKDYDLEAAQELKAARCIMVDGDAEIAEGIKLYKAPGHTLGSQLVAVTTTKGTVVFAGDIALMNFMAFPGIDEIMDMDGVTHKIPHAPPIFGPSIPHTIIYDFYAYYDSVYKMKAIAAKDEPGYIIPGHEPSLVLTGV